MAEEVLEILQSVGAFRTGHFVLTTGRHSDAYINKDALYPYTKEVSRLCEKIAEKYAGKGVEAVIGPAYGAIILSTWTAHHLSRLDGKAVLGVYADKSDDGPIIRRGYDKLIAGKNTIVVEDLTTTGSSLKKVVEAGRAAGANVIAAVTICNRGDVTAEQIGNPPVFDSLVTVHLESWTEADCELCKAGIPVNTDVGHGKDFLSKQGMK